MKYLILLIFSVITFCILLSIIIHMIVSRDNYCVNKNITKNDIKKCSTRKNWNTIDDRSKKYLLPAPFLKLLVNETKLWKKNTMDHDVQTENLKILKEFLESRNISYFIDCGTLLGAVRDNNIIKGDTDADIQITQGGLDKLREDIKELEDVGFIAWRNEDNGYMGLSLMRNGEYVDFYRTFVNSGAIQKFPFNLVSYPFLGTQFPVPKNYEEYLTELYGNWKVPSSHYEPHWENGMPNYMKKYGKTKCISVGKPQKDTSKNFSFLWDIVEERNVNSMPSIQCPIYYINLDRSPDRRAFMEKQFQKIGVNSQVKRISAVDGKKLPHKHHGVIDTDFGNISYKNNYDMYTIGELGCTLSHILAIKKSYYNGDKLALIIEDDVNILPLALHTNNKLNKIMSEAPSDWGIISLICYENCRKNCRSLKNGMFVPYRENNKCYSTGAYLINRKGMEKIINGMKPLEITLDKHDSKNSDRIVADFFLYHRCNHTYFYCDKKILCIPGLFDSTIQDTNGDLTQYYDTFLDRYTFTNLDNNKTLYSPKISTPIPKIIHQTWKTNTLPDNFKRWSTECKKIHDDWDHFLWSDDDNRNFIAQEYPNFLPIYDSYDVNIKRVDAVRYFYLYHFGGVYMDLDFVCLKNLDDILKDGKAIFGYQLKDKNATGSIANAFMAAPPKHPLFKILIENLIFTTDLHVLKATGPGYLTNIINKYKQDDYIVHEMPILYTNEWDKKDVRLKDCEKDVDKCRQHFPDSYTTTIWTGSWL